jgi:hypothetical protein
MPLESFADVKVGDRLLFVDGPHTGEVVTVEKLHDHSGTFGARSRLAWVLRPSGELSGGWFPQRFEKVETVKEAPKVANEARSAMSFQTAAQELQRLIQAGIKGGTLRQRSWDTKGLYAGIDINGTSLYTPEKVAEYIASQTPVDVVGTPTRYHDAFYFTVPGTGSYLPSRHGYNYWTSADIANAKGLAQHGGKTYRLCVNKVVPLYQP